MNNVISFWIINIRALLNVKCKRANKTNWSSDAKFYVDNTKVIKTIYLHIYLNDKNIQSE